MTHFTIGSKKNSETQAVENKAPSSIVRKVGHFRFELKPGGVGGVTGSSAIHIQKRLEDSEGQFYWGAFDGCHSGEGCGTYSCHAQHQVFEVLRDIVFGDVK